MGTHRYRITVAGALGGTGREVFADFAIEANGATTVLSGDLDDAGLYQTGATTHPGGSITGAPGRNAAIVLLHDLGHDPDEVLSAAPTA